MPASATATDYDAFLHAHVHSQPHSVMRYDVDGESLWVKRAGATVPGWRLRVLGAAAKALRMPVLTPVPNPGGRAAMAIEVARLQDLQRRGLRVPTVLAHCADGFVMRHLGAPGQETPNLGNAMEEAMPRGAHAVLALWKQGLQAIAKVHKAGTCLSQAFARNLVRCPDGEVACIDFEDDPAAVLPLAVCHVRDALCYAHSTAIYLHTSGTLTEGRARWAAWVAQGSAEMREVLATSVRRMGWMRHLPTNRKLGRDLQRVRAAYDLLA